MKHWQCLKDDDQRRAWMDGRISYFSGMTNNPCQNETLASIWQAGYDMAARHDYERGEG